MGIAAPAKKAWWPWVKRAAAIVFVLVVGALLVTHARSIDWAEVWQSLSDYRASTLAVAAALAAVSHLLFCSYDLLARVYTQHKLGRAQVLAVASICYAFTLNFGALIGGVGFRYRLYSRLGLDSAVITRVYVFSLTSNWLGFLILGGAVFAFRQIEIPAAWAVGAGSLQIAGAVLMAVAAAYFAVCAWSRRRNWSVRGHELTLPSLRMAAMQALISVCNWLVMALVIYVLLERKIELTTIAGVLMVSAVAGVIAHVPAGLGVLEAVFIALLGDRMPAHQLLAGLLAYRAIYYLCPLAIAAVLYVVTEMRAGRLRRGRAGRRRPEPGIKAAAPR